MDELAFPKMWYVPDERTFADLNSGKIRLGAKAQEACAVGTLTVRDESFEFQGRGANIVMAEVHSIQLVTTDRDPSPYSWALRVNYGRDPSIAFLYDARITGNRKRMASIADAIRAARRDIEIVPPRHMLSANLVGTEAQRRAERAAVDHQRGVDKVPLEAPVILDHSNMYEELSPWVGATWSDVAPEHRELIENALTGDEHPYLVGHETGLRATTLHVATNQALVVVSLRKGSTRFAWDEVEDLHPGMLGRVAFTFRGEAVTLKPERSYFWLIVERRPGLARSILVQPEELAGASPEHLTPFRIKCLLGAEKVDRSFIADVLLNEKGLGQYMVVSIDVVTKRAIGETSYFCPAACPLCGTPLLVHVAGRGLVLDLWVYDGLGWPVKWLESRSVARVGSMGDIPFKRHEPAK